jgi:transcriptional pleiotropic regulator of transition state genes
MVIWNKKGGNVLKSTGIVRRIDELGRVVIPKELRRGLEIENKDPIEIYVEDEKIILKKFKANMECDITGQVSEENESFFNGKLVLSPEGKTILLEQLSKK